MYIDPPYPQKFLQMGVSHYELGSDDVVGLCGGCVVDGFDSVDGFARWGRVMEQENLKRGIQSYLDEWLDCYCLLGFDSVGNLVQIHVANSDRDILALDKAYKDWYEETFDVEPFEAECEWEDGEED